MAGKRINLGIVGLGRMGSLFFKLLISDPDLLRVFSLKAVVTSKPERVRDLIMGEANSRVRVFNDLEEALRRGDLNAIIIATPSYTHPRLAKRALESGVHVFTEKPLGLSLREALEVAKLARESGLVLSVGFMRRFSQTATLLKSKFRDGRFSTYLGISRDPEPPPEGWLRDPRKSGGLIFDLGSHEFDAFLWLLSGNPKFLDLLRDAEVLCTGTLGNLRGILDDEDLARATVIVRTSESEGVFLLSRTSPAGYEVKVEVVGESQVFAHGWEQREKKWFSEAFREEYKLELLDFGESILRARAPRCDGLQGCLSVAVAEASLRSQRERRWVSLMEVDGFQELLMELEGAQR